MQRSYLVPLAEAPASDRMTFVTVMNFVLRNLKFMLIVGLALAVISPLPLIGREPQYTASARFLTEAERPAGGFLGELELPGTAGRGPGFYIDLMRSPVVLEAVARAPIELQTGKSSTTLVEHYAKRPPTDSEAVRGVATGLMGKINANVGGTGIITLRVSADDPLVAAATARELLTQTDDFNATKLRSQARRERDFAEARLKIAERERDAAEAAWLSFVKRNRIVSAPELQIEQGRLQDSLTQKRGVVSMLVTAIERTRLDEARETARAIVLQPPLPPTSPSYISWQRVALVGFFAGMFIAAFVALIRDYFARVVTQPTPEAQEFAALRAASTAQIGRPIRALVDTVRKPRPTPLQ